MSRAAVLMLALAALAACGPTSTKNNGDDDTDGGTTCKAGATEVCYDGVTGTAGVGPCQAGMHTCTASGTWGPCTGEVIPAGETCGDSIDNNCNGMVDENVDSDGDGFTTCGGDCCDSTECTNPKAVNPGAFDASGNGIDDDCDGHVDNGDAACDSGLASNSSMAMDFARAIDLCQTTTSTAKTWGVIDAKLTLANGSGTPATKSHSIRTHFGTGLMPHAGSSFAELSTGAAAGKGDSNPNYEDLQHTPSLSGNNTQSAFPTDFYAANNNALPNAPNCPKPSGSSALDPVMLTLTVRVPTNAKSFTLDTNFFSSEFPEYTCSQFNDFFVVLLNSTYNGTPANPADRNLAVYTPMNSTTSYPVGVNLASGNTGLFTQCQPGHISCRIVANQPTITTCMGTNELAGTGLDTPDPGQCDNDSVEGGGTGWLRVTGNVVPGEIITLRIAIWDTSDHVLDSIAIVDAFKWSLDTSTPGTVIF